jgi:hypothetical protein
VSSGIEPQDHYDSQRFSLRLLLPGGFAVIRRARWLTDYQIKFFQTAEPDDDLKPRDVPSIAN